ncbi:hypothetical protein N9X61_01235 [Sulfurimonas sp.]|nr:hypothetical protein [Sulfurimonas sp.]
MYRSELNGYFPRDLVQEEYRRHLAVALTKDGESYASNQAVEDLLNNVALMESIHYDIMDKSLNEVHENLDCEYIDPKGKI